MDTTSIVTTPSVITSDITTSTIEFLHKPLSQYQPQDMGLTILVVCVVVILLVLAFKKGI